MNIWVIILGMAAVTYGPRVLPLTALKEEALPMWVRRGLKYVPIAVLSAIVGPAFVPSEAWVQFSVGAPLIAGAAAIGTAWYTHNIVATIGVGMATLILFS